MRKQQGTNKQRVRVIELMYAQTRQRHHNFFLLKILLYNKWWELSHTYKSKKICKGKQFKSTHL